MASEGPGAMVSEEDAQPGAMASTESGAIVSAMASEGPGAMVSEEDAQPGASAEPSVKLKSSNGKVFNVGISVARMSITIKNMLEDIGDEEDTPIPLPAVSSNILDKVIRYCEHHKDDEPTSEAGVDSEIVGFDAEFVKVDQATLFEMIMAANFLDLQPMLNLTCKTVAKMITGKTPEEIRTTFGIKNDFTPEEEEQVRKENAWAEDKS